MGTAGAPGGQALPGPTIPHAHRGLFKTDRVLGTAQLKLEALETACEVRELLEVRGRLTQTPRCATPLGDVTQMLPQATASQSLLC